MINNKSKLGAVLAVAVAMTLSAASAEARVAHHEADVHSTVRGAHVHQRAYRGSYNYAPVSGGTHFAEPNGSDNYNPNEG